MRRRKIDWAEIREALTTGIMATRVADGLHDLVIKLLHDLTGVLF